MTDRELIAAIDAEMEGRQRGFADARGELLFRCRDALASRPDGWSGIESAPRDRPFWARKSNNEIALCWRHNPSSRTDEVVTWNGNQGFRAVEWRYPDPLPPAPKP